MRICLVRRHSWLKVERTGQEQMHGSMFNETYWTLKSHDNPSHNSSSMFNESTNQFTPQSQPLTVMP